MQSLSSKGFEWLSHYSSVDIIHEEHGLEVCGIHDQEDAEFIRALLHRLYPSWHRG